MPELGIRATFEDLFNVSPEVVADAPGRVNLIGEHTDYHDGFVLPTVIPQRTHVQGRRRCDDRVRVWSAGLGDHVHEYCLGCETRGRGWLDYVQGVSATLARLGAHVSGFDLRIESTVPVGGGVSSSAALEVSVLRALREIFSLPLDDVELARAAQRVETEFVGAPVGIMDQMASSVGRDGEALFLDTRSLAMQHIPLPRGAELVVVNSGVTHQHAGGKYATRRAESFDAATLLGVSRLRDMTLDELPRIATLPPVLARRARHVVSENHRVLEAVDALRRDDAAALGMLFNASHASIRDDYETSTSDIDTLVEIAQRHADIYGARLTGGGFGGAVVMLARTGTGHAASLCIVTKYRGATGRDGAVLIPE